jgi:hypothetical protein
LTACSLSRAGYGTLSEIEKLDTPDFLDLVEFERINRDIEKHLIDRER